ncbi:hypothetical protein T492DRAFT_1069375, partial [Pavlovales sp. CCMP2436]
MAAADRSFAARFREPYLFSEGGISLEIEQEPATDLSREALDTGCTVWPAAIALARLALAPHASPTVAALVCGARVVELGAGTGLAGIACAGAGASAVLLTDLPGRLPLLARNARRNGWVSTLGGTSLGTAGLDWTDVEGNFAADARLREADVTLLIGADLVHDVAQCAPLAECVNLLLHKWPGCQHMIWAQQRHCALAVAELRGLLARDFDFETVGTFEGGAGELLLGRRCGKPRLADDARSGGGLD